MAFLKMQVTLLEIGHFRFVVFWDSNIYGQFMNYLNLMIYV